MGSNKTTGEENVYIILIYPEYSINSAVTM